MAQPRKVRLMLDIETDAPLDVLRNPAAYRKDLVNPDDRYYVMYMLTIIAIEAKVWDEEARHD